MTGRRVDVFGPTYLDRVLRVAGPLIGGGQGDSIDQSVEGEWMFGDPDRINVIACDGSRLDMSLPTDWTGPRGTIQLRGPIRDGWTGRRAIRAIRGHDDLGGMGAGYAAALDGVLHSALGPETDPVSRAVAEWMAHYGIRHQAIRIPDRAADWTLLVTSGESGDKLAIGFRGCHASLDAGDLARRAEASCDLRVVAAWPNRLVDPILRAPGARTRFFAPSLRNMADRDNPLVHFADRIDLLSCNRVEWETLAERESVAEAVPIVVVTEGPHGCDVRFKDIRGQSRRFHVPAFPRARPPSDTNRAGEAFASTIVTTLVEQGWDGGSRFVDESLMRMATGRAAASAALELDRVEFGFPTVEEIDAALQTGRVQ
jgi:ribokinase